MTQHLMHYRKQNKRGCQFLLRNAERWYQAACKILRHGYESANSGFNPENNRHALERELGDLGHAIRRMEIAADINPLSIAARAASKAQRIEAYLHHQNGSKE